MEHETIFSFFETGITSGLNLFKFSDDWCMRSNYSGCIYCGDDDRYHHATKSSMPVMEKKVRKATSTAYVKPTISIFTAKSNGLENRLL